MAGSVATFPASGIPGLTLRAWVMVGNGGEMLKSWNVSGVVRNNTGDITVTFSAAFADAAYVADARFFAAGDMPHAWGVAAQSLGTASVRYVVRLNGTATDGRHWVGFYG